jgi:hypothetical protein
MRPACGRINSFRAEGDNRVHPAGPKNRDQTRCGRNQNQTSGDSRQGHRIVGTHLKQQLSQDPLAGQAGAKPDGDPAMSTMA